MKVVYVLTASPGDAYCAMTRLSAASLRLTNPGATAVVACDAETDQTLRAAKEPLIGEVDEWLAFETPPGPPVFRNRFIKTSLRQRIQGPYLYLDGDTILRDDLSAVFSVPGDVGGAPNHSRESYDHQVSGIDKAILAQMEWSISPTVYVNGGALYASESDGAHRFYRLWHDKWLESYRRRGDYRDQPALNSAIWESRASCSILPRRFNAQITHAPESAADAAIWHYYSARKRDGYNNIDEFIRQSMGMPRLDLGKMAELISGRIHWNHSFWNTEYGEMAIRSAALERLQAILDGGPEVVGFDDLIAVDARYARAVLVKVAVDAYWSDMPQAFWQAWKVLFRRFPSSIGNPNLRRCLLHRLGCRLKMGAHPRG